MRFLIIASLPAHCKSNYLNALAISLLQRQQLHDDLPGSAYQEEQGEAMLSRLATRLRRATSCAGNNEANVQFQLLALTGLQATSRSGGLSDGTEAGATAWLRTTLTKLDAHAWSAPVLPVATGVHTIQGVSLSPLMTAPPDLATRPTLHYLERVLLRAGHSMTAATGRTAATPRIMRSAFTAAGLRSSADSMAAASAARAFLYVARPVRPTFVDVVSSASEASTSEDSAITSSCSSDVTSESSAAEDSD